jgi:hypothetical protein
LLGFLMTGKWQCAVCGKYSDTKRGVCAPVKYK